MTRLARTSLVTHCPYKGDASYWSIRSGPRIVENAVWSYETPYDDMAPIRDTWPSTRIGWTRSRSGRSTASR